MTTNYEWLLAMEGAERQAWFDAEHVDTCPIAAEPSNAELEGKDDMGGITQSDGGAQSSVSENSSDAFSDSREQAVYENLHGSSADEQNTRSPEAEASDHVSFDGQKVTFDDSREKLESDIDKLVTALIADARNCEAATFSWESRDFYRLLDRQASITERKMPKSHPHVGLVRGKHHEKREISDCYCGRCGYPVTDHDSYCRECGAAFHSANQPIGESDVPKAPEITETATAKGDIRDFDDSREKLEHDVTAIVRKASIWARQKIEALEGSLFMLDAYDPLIRELLDRQAAITERECREYEDALREQHHKRIAELQAELGEARAKCREMHNKWIESTAAWERITQLDCTDVQRIDKLLAQRDELMAAIVDLGYKQPRTFDPEAPYDTAELVARYIAELLAQRDEARQCVDELKAKIKDYADRATRAEVERERFRVDRGKLLDIADEIRRIATVD